MADLLGRLERGELVNAETVLAYLAGGDPHREVGVDDRAVKALATDLWSEQRRAALAAGLDGLALAARDLPHVRETVLALARDLDLAWRLYALALLAEELGDDD